MRLKNKLLIVLLIGVLVACKEKNNKTEYAKDLVSTEEIGEQNENVIDSLAFNRLVNLTDSTAKQILNDSLAFLIIPLDAVCPHCRDKAIKALFANRSKIPNEHYVIITAASYKGIKAFFADKSQETPEAKGKIFIDGESEAFKNNLVFMHPTVYYTHNKQVVSKIISYPTNIDKVLEDFFKG